MEAARGGKSKLEAPLVLAPSARHDTLGPLKKAIYGLEQDRPDVLKRQHAWFDGQFDLDPQKLIFLDGTGL